MPMLVILGSLGTPLAGRAAVRATLVRAVLAHQGGWDEFLWVAAPIVVVFVLLWRANSRAKEIARRRGVSASRSD